MRNLKSEISQAFGSDDPQFIKTVMKHLVDELSCVYQGGTNQEWLSCFICFRQSDKDGVSIEHHPDCPSLR